jgi:hypothetical protein
MQIDLTLWADYDGWDMTEPQSTGKLLHTKLMPPRIHPAVISRPALSARLTEGLTKKLTLVNAPTGFGKTTLVRLWLSDRKISSAWVALGGNDNDPVRFWTYVITALRTFDPAVGKTALAALTTSHIGTLPAWEKSALASVSRCCGKIGCACETESEQRDDGTVLPRAAVGLRRHRNPDGERVGRQPVPADRAAYLLQDGDAQRQREDGDRAGFGGRRPEPDVPTLIEQLDGLRKQGVLTDEEFQKKKAELLTEL